MKRLLFSMAIFVGTSLAAQKNIVKKTTWHNNALQATVQANNTVHSFRFYKYDNGHLEIEPDTVLPQHKRLVYDNRYSTVYLGHKYLFEKQYGRFPAEILVNKLDSLRRTDCYTNEFEGRIYADHIDIKLTSSCPDKSGDRVFYKVDDHPGFLGGPAAFQQMVQDRIRCTHYQDQLQGDSAFFFFAVVKKDSICHELRSADSIQSPLRAIIRDALTNTHGWKPYRKDGRNMNAYLQVFVFLRKDGSIEADYLR